MCGIAGIFDQRGGQEALLLARANAMADTLVHRGPDDSGAWADGAAGIALSHRRLSIIDLSESGHQPMVSVNGRFVIVYNGEIYNFSEIKAELIAGGASFDGHSDTEVIIEAWAAWGGLRTVERLIGMFAFAIWDCHERTLTVVRDRLGIKPLYWGQFGKTILFGSELKALRAYPEWKPELDRNVLAAYLRHAYVPGPDSIYRGVQKLEPGTMLVVGDDGTPELRRYWSLDDAVRTGRVEPLNLSDKEATDRLEELLGDAVERRMIADVPLGAFLSGGVDSSCVVALMQACNKGAVKTFTLGFKENGYDEAEHAAKVARHLGTEHTELYVEPADALRIIPRLAEMFDEPFADPSQIPTFLISELTRRKVTVVLSGDGGDELFGGYNRYLLMARLWRYLERVPGPLCSAAARMILAVPPSLWDKLMACFPPASDLAQAGDKLHKLAALLDSKNPDELYLRLISHWQDPGQLVPGAREPVIGGWDGESAKLTSSDIDRMRYLDIRTYLAEDILTKLDRASMAASLETRVPILDHRVVEFSWGLSDHQRIRNGETKWLLRQVLYRHVPKALINRPKMGFGVPIDAWLRGPLRDWAESLLSEECLGAGGILNQAPIRKRWQEHLDGRRNWQYSLWNVLMFQAWRERNLS
jgi:asparagine synthase (glutamine-hydrolysing)